MCKGVSLQYSTGNFKSIGLKEYMVRKLTGNYSYKEFRADRDNGDILGIICTDSAGKSTLLKAFSGILVFHSIFSVCKMCNTVLCSAGSRQANHILRSDFSLLQYVQACHEKCKIPFSPEKFSRFAAHFQEVCLAKKNTASWIKKSIKSWSLLQKNRPDLLKN